MSNVLSPSFKQYWSRRMQQKHHKIDVFRAIANFEEEAILFQGDRVHRPTKSNVAVQNYTRGTDLVIQDVSTADEYLIVDTAKAAPFYIDDLDQLQSSYKYKNQFADDCAKKLGNNIDGEVLSEVVNAKNVVDDSAFGGTSGNGITLTTGNVQKVFSAVDKKLNRGSVDLFERYGVISPDFNEILMQLLSNRETPQGDNIGINGFVRRYFNMDLHMSNASYWTGELLVGTQPTNGDTVVINGVTYTFVTSLGSTAGNVLIGADANAAMANLVAAINGASGAGSTYIALSDANRALMAGIVATAGTGKVTLAAKGLSYVTVSETLTAAADIWTPAKQIQHLMFGQKGSVDVVIQARPDLLITQPPLKIGKNFIPYTLYGKKTFTEGAEQLVDVQIRTDGFI